MSEEDDAAIFARHLSSRPIEHRNDESRFQQEETGDSLGKTHVNVTDVENTVSNAEDAPGSANAKAKLLNVDPNSLRKDTKLRTDVKMSSLRPAAPLLVSGSPVDISPGNSPGVLGSWKSGSNSPGISRQLSQSKNGLSFVRGRVHQTKSVSGQDKTAHAHDHQNEAGEQNQSELSKQTTDDDLKQRLFSQLTVIASAVVKADMGEESGEIGELELPEQAQLTSEPDEGKMSPESTTEQEKTPKTNNNLQTQQHIRKGRLSSFHGKQFLSEEQKGHMVMTGSRVLGKHGGNVDSTSFHASSAERSGHDDEGKPVIDDGKLIADGSVTGAGCLHDDLIDSLAVVGGPASSLLATKPLTMSPSNFNSKSDKRTPEQLIHNQSKADNPTLEQLIHNQSKPESEVEIESMIETPSEGQLRNKCDARHSRELVPMAITDLVQTRLPAAPDSIHKTPRPLRSETSSAKGISKILSQTEGTQHHDLTSTPKTAKMLSSELEIPSGLSAETENTLNGMLREQEHANDLSPSANNRKGKAQRYIRKPHFDEVEAAHFKNASYAARARGVTMLSYSGVSWAKVDNHGNIKSSTPMQSNLQLQEQPGSVPKFMSNSTHDWAGSSARSSHVQPGPGRKDSVAILPPESLMAAAQQNDLSQDTRDARSQQSRNDQNRGLHENSSWGGWVEVTDILESVAPLLSESLARQPRQVAVDGGQVAEERALLAGILESHDRRQYHASRSLAPLLTDLESASVSGVLAAKSLLKNVSLNKGDSAPKGNAIHIKHPIAEENSAEACISPNSLEQKSKSGTVSQTDAKEAQSQAETEQKTSQVATQSKSILAFGGAMRAASKWKTKTREHSLMDLFHRFDDHAAPPAQIESDNGAAGSKEQGKAGPIMQTKSTPGGNHIKHMVENNNNAMENQLESQIDETLTAMDVDSLDPNLKDNVEGASVIFGDLETKMDQLSHDMDDLKDGSKVLLHQTALLDAGLSDRSGDQQKALKEYMNENLVGARNMTKNSAQSSFSVAKRRSNTVGKTGFERIAPTVQQRKAVPFSAKGLLSKKCSEEVPQNANLEPFAGTDLPPILPSAMNAVSRQISLDNEHQSKINKALPQNSKDDALQNGLEASFTPVSASAKHQMSQNHEWRLNVLRRDVELLGSPFKEVVVPTAKTRSGGTDAGRFLGDHLASRKMPDHYSSNSASQIVFDSPEVECNLHVPEFMTPDRHSYVEACHSTCSANSTSDPAGSPLVDMKAFVSDSLDQMPIEQPKDFFTRARDNLLQMKSENSSRQVLAVAQGLQCNNEIVEVSLNDCQVAHFCFWELARSLKSHASVLKLKIVECPNIADISQSYSQKIQEIATRPHPETGVYHKAAASKSRPVLSATCDRLTQMTMQSIAQLCCLHVTEFASLVPKATCASLQHLALDGCKLGDPGCIALCNELGAIGNCSLKVLSLRRNGLSKPSAEHISDLLKAAHVSNGSSRQCWPALNALQELNVDWNRLMGDGIGLILKSLECHSAIQHVDASWNSVGHKVLPGICCLLGNNPHIQSISLGYNRLDPASCAVIAEALHRNTAIGGNFALFGMEGNRIGAVGLEMLRNSRPGLEVAVKGKRNKNAANDSLAQAAARLNRTKVRS